MRITTSDGTFGFVIEPTEAADFQIFQLVIDSEVIGDREPCILGTAMRQLRNLAVLDLGPLGPSGFSAPEILSTIKSRDDWNDATLRHLAESIDRWDLRGYSTGSEAVFIARPNGPNDVQVLLTAVVPLSDYVPIVDVLVQHWEQLRRG